MSTGAQPASSGNHTLTALEDYVAAGEPRQALEELRNLLSGLVYSDAKFREFDKEAILQLSRLSRMEKNQRRGIVDAGSGDQALARISSAVLDLIEDVERASRNSSRLPVFQTPIVLPPNQDAALEKVWGRNTLKSLSWLHEGLKRAKSVCRVVSPIGLGSGFIVGSGVLITNNHVLKSAEQAKLASVEFNFEEDENGKLCPVTSYTLDSSLFATNEQLDCTAVKIVQGNESIGLSTWGRLTAELQKRPEIGDHVTIIQHPHGGLKQIGLTSNQVVNVFDYRLQYMTDTLPGSSGSPVFNDDWCVIAIHHAGGNLTKNRRGDTIFANEGILMSEIVRVSEINTLIVESP
jgi:V8-like Glu-specific endopeptidase